ncbi:zinc ribbon domain-containing protein [Halorubrum gandharaense]
MSETSRRRPWLAALLAVVFTGLGHAYLRRWGRAFGWLLLQLVAAYLLVPEAALDQLVAGSEIPPLGEVFPIFAVAVASVADAYLLAVRHNRTVERAGDATTAPADGPNESGSAATGAGALNVRGSAGTADAGDEPPVTDCPHCGREVDAELDFCHWCTEPLPGADEE